MAHESTVEPKLTLAKILLYGDESVGKTCLLLRFANDSFNPDYVTTIGIDFKVKTISLPNKDRVKLQIWDTAGQERYRSISKAYLRGADVICIVYDVTKPSSFEKLPSLISPEVQNPDITKFLVGNKIDMEVERKVTFEDGKKYADEQGYELREVSAASGQGVNDLFLSVAKDAYRKKNPGSQIGWSSSATSFFKKQ